MWIAVALLTFIWLVLKFVFHKGGYIHMILVGDISILVVQLIAQRKAHYHKTAAK
jgi:hypothetical protein